MRSMVIASLTVVSCATLGCADQDALPASGSALQFQPQPPPLYAPDGAASDFFGYSVALSGRTAVIGAPRHEVDSKREQGAAYVFVSDGQTWHWQATLTAGDGAANDHFGYSVAISGDTALVGAPGHAAAEPFQGAAYAFVRSAGSWSQQGGALAAEDGKAADAFGTAVAVSEADQVVADAIVGAPYHDVNGHDDQGAAYTFARRAGAWSQRGAALVGDNGRAGEIFGNTVALDGPTALVGAPIHQVGANPYQGGVYVYVDDGTAWAQQGPVLTASDGGPFDQLSQCALSGDRALLGAPAHVLDGVPMRGAAYLFSRHVGTWQEEQRLGAEDGATGDIFGSGVALSGSTALVAAPGRAAGSQGPSGGVYHFAASEQQAWSQQAPVWTATDGAPNELFGPPLALSGSFAIVGSPYHDLGASAAQGAVYTFAAEPIDER